MNFSEKLLAKVNEFARVLEEQQIRRLHEQKLDCDANIQNSKSHIHIGKKYIRVDTGHSGKYMIDMNGDIWGIKAYGVIHLGHQYGNLDTIGNYDWSGYHATRRRD